MANEVLTQSLAQQAMDPRDPFQVARDKYDQSGQTALSSSLQSPLDALMGSQQSPQLFKKAEASPQAQMSLNDIFKRSDNQPNQSTDNQLRSLMQGLNINPSEISLNPIGKMQLMSRLKTKFGDSFMENSQVKDLMGQFDQYLIDNKTDVQQSMSKMSNNANSTLAMLGMK